MKQTICIDKDGGKQIAFYPDRLQVEAGADFYVDQERWIVVDALPDGEGVLVIVLEKPDGD